MLHHTGNKVVRHLGDTAAVDVLTIGRIKQIAPRLTVSQRHVVVRAAAGTVGRGFGHKAGEAAVLTCDFIRHQAEKHQAISHAECVGIGKVSFKLAVGVLMIKGVNIPAHGIHRFNQFTNNRHVVHQAARVIAGLGQRVARADRLEATLFGITKQEELRFNTQVKGQPHVSGLCHLALEDVTRARFKGRTVQIQIAGKPSQLGVPGTDSHGGCIGHGRHFVVANILWHTIECGPGVQF